MLQPTFLQSGTCEPDGRRAASWHTHYPTYTLQGYYAMLCHVYAMLTRLRLSLVAVVNNFGIIQALHPKPELKAHLNHYPP